MSYTLGFDDIMTLREERQRIEGNDFCLRDFHRDLLKHGTIPVAKIRRLNGWREGAAEERSERGT
eukprot:10057-Eustigmatos_ZCMA.PRE.1